MFGNPQNILRQSISSSLSNGIAPILKEDTLNMKCTQDTNLTDAL